MRFEMEFFPYPAVLGAVLLLAVLVWNWRKGRSWPYLLFLSLFWVYILVVLNLLFFPIRVPQEWPGNVTPENTLGILSHANYIPLNLGYLLDANASVVFEQLIGNILLTLPFGFLLPFLVCIPSRRVVGLALLAGLALEGAQLLIGLSGLIGGYGHSSDINDVILNAMGVLVGYGLYRGFAWLYRAWVSRFRLSTNALFQFFNQVTAQ